MVHRTRKQTITNAGHTRTGWSNSVHLLIFRVFFLGVGVVFVALFGTHAQRDRSASFVRAPTVLAERRQQWIPITSSTDRGQHNAIEGIDTYSGQTTNSATRPCLTHTIRLQVTTTTMKKRELVSYRKGKHKGR